MYNLYNKAMLSSALGISATSVSNSSTSSGKRRGLLGHKQTLLQTRPTRSLESVLPDVDVFGLIGALAQAVYQSNTILLESVLEVREDVASTGRLLMALADPPCENPPAHTHKVSPL